MRETLTFVLVHAPLVGPSTWSWVATELKEQGCRVHVPCLTGVERAENPFDHCVDAVRSTIPQDQSVVLIGHSGSGVLLPFIAQLPIHYYDHSVDVPANWTGTPAGYVLLSEGYREFAQEAKVRCWPVTEIAAKHLHMVEDPSAVATTLIELAREHSD